MKRALLYPPRLVLITQGCKLPHNWDRLVWFMDRGPMGQPPFTVHIRNERVELVIWLLSPSGTPSSESRPDLSSESSGARTELVFCHDMTKVTKVTSESQTFFSMGIYFR
jgi:hypothetical protein